MKGCIVSKAIAADEFKTVVKDALRETLEEQRDWLHEIVAEVLEDFALARAVSEGLKTKRASRTEVFRILDRKS